MKRQENGRLEGSSRRLSRMTIKSPAICDQHILRVTFLHAGLFLGFFFDPEDGSNIFL
jgi:hypothetical protein